MASKPKKRQNIASDSQLALFGRREVPEEFRKAVEIVHSTPLSHLTLLQRKLSNAMVRNVVETPSEPGDWWSISLQDLERDVGFDSNNREYLRDAARALMKVHFEWDILAKGSRKGMWKASVLFPEVELHSDILRYQVSPHLREQILKPNVFALIDMTVLRRFRRAPSVVIYEFSIRFEGLGHTAVIAWTELRDMILGQTVESTTYQEYKYFKSKILNPSIAEINSESNIRLTLHENRLGRRISTIWFSVERAVPESPAADDEEGKALIAEMVALGVLKSEATRLLASHGQDSVSAAVRFTRLRVSDKKKTPIDNPAAFFRVALQKGYAEAPSPTSPSSRAPQKKDGKIDLREALLEERTKAADHDFHLLDHNDQTVLIDRYNAQQQIPNLRVGKRVTKAAERAFARWLALDQWGEPTTEDLLAFAQAKLTNVAP